jgi:hypothetical protein
MRPSYDYREVYADFMLQVLSSESGDMWQAKIYHSYDYGVTWTLSESISWDSDFHKVLRQGREILFEAFKYTVYWDDDYGAKLSKRRFERNCERWE